MKCSIHTFCFCLVLLCAKVSFSQTISAGHDYSLFLCSSGIPKASGMNWFGELGDGTTTTTYSTPPVSITSLNNITDVSAGGSHSLFLKNDGTVWACGLNFDGQLGLGSNVDEHLPVQLPTLTGIKEIAAGWAHSLFLKDDGTVWATGDNNFGQLGDGTTSDHNLPFQIPSLTNVIKISVGEFHSIFLKSNGTVWACGKNTMGQLGDGTTINRIFPVPINALNGISGVKAIAAGWDFSIFLKTSGDIFACGNNNYGQFGDGTINSDSIPVHSIPLSNIIAIAAGNYHSLFVRNDGTAWASGANYNGQLGDGTNIATLANPPVQVSGISNVVSVSAGFLQSLFQLNDGSGFACGHNVYGELCDGTVASWNVPMPMLMDSCTIPFANIKEQKDQILVNIYPNPSSHGYFKVNNPAGLPIELIRIYNVFGEEVYSTSDNNIINSFIPVNNLAAGTYYIQILSPLKSIHQKIIIY